MKDDLDPAVTALLAKRLAWRLFAHFLTLCVALAVFVARVSTLEEKG